MIPVVVGVLTVESNGPYGGHTVLLSGHPIGYRAYDGSDSSDIASDVLEAFAELLRERLGWPENGPSDNNY